MGCNCGKKLVYEVTKANGQTEQAKTLSQAMSIIRQSGGTYKRVRA